MTDPTWTMKPLVDLCKRSDGIRCGPFGTQLKKDEFRKAGVPLWGIKHVNAKFQFATDEFVEAATAGRLAQYDLIPGDLAMTRKGTIGNCAVYPEAFPLGIMHSDLLRLRLDLGEADPSFFVHQLHHSSDVHRQLASISGGAVMPGINVGRLKKLMVRVPPLAEQKRIAAILDAADALRAKRREALAQLDTLIQSTFLDMFGDPVSNPMDWPPTSLAAISKELRDGPFGSNLKSSHYVESGVRVIRLQNIGVGEIRNDDLAFISEEHFASLPRNHCRPGDLIIGTMGDPNLRACIVPSALARALNKADCILMRVDMTKVDAIYVCWLLNNPCMVSMALRLVRGQTRGRISLGRLKELQIHLPPIELQLRFAAMVKSVEHQKASQRAHLGELDTLFASLQSRAFRGDL